MILEGDGVGDTLRNGGGVDCGCFEMVLLMAMEIVCW
jgi:hypothetical protein